MKQATETISDGNFEQAASLILEYYDRTYNFSLEKRKQSQVLKLPPHSINPKINAQVIIRFAGSIN